MKQRQRGEIAFRPDEQGSSENGFRAVRCTYKRRRGGEEMVGECAFRGLYLDGRREALPVPMPMSVCLDQGSKKTTTFPTRCPTHTFT
jgi:hypothetical protein